MKDEWKVYIKGDPTRGNEIIKLLTNLGGTNNMHYTGTDEDAIYFIDTKGEIDWTSNSNTSMILPYIKEFYKEMKLPRWKPKYYENYYFINYKGMVMRSTWVNSVNEDIMYEFGNCFRTKKEAEATRDKIKELLNNKA